MKKLGSALLVGSGLALAVATFYDASVLAQALGVPVDGGEAVVVVASLSLSGILLLFGIRGLRKRPLDGISRGAV